MKKLAIVEMVLAVAGAAVAGSLFTDVDSYTVPDLIGDVNTALNALEDSIDGTTPMASPVVKGTLTAISTNEASTNVIVTADALIDGEYIADDSIDNDSIDWADMTDLTTDGAVVWGNIAEGELGASKITSSNIKDGEIVDADVNASAAIASTKLSGIAAAPSAGGSVSGVTNTVTITAQDSAGATNAARRLLRVWMSEAAYGVPSTNNIESVTLSGGTAIQTVTAAADYVYLTAATGIASAEIVGSAAGTNYVNVADGGYVTSAAVVFE